MLRGPVTPGEAPKRPAILTNLTEAEYVSVADLAAQADESLSGFVRSLIRHRLTETAV